MLDESKGGRGRCGAALQSPAVLQRLLILLVVVCVVLVIALGVVVGKAGSGAPAPSPPAPPPPPTARRRFFHITDLHVDPF